MPRRCRQMGSSASRSCRRSCSAQATDLGYECAFDPTDPGGQASTPPPPSSASMEQGHDELPSPPAESESNKYPKLAYVPTRELQDANDLYKKVMTAVTGMSRPVKRSNLEKANLIYGREVTKCFGCRDYDSAGSILRNVGMTNLRLAEIVDNLDPNQEFQEIIYFLTEAITAFTKALSVRSGDLDTEWGLLVQEKIQDCFGIGLLRGAARGQEKEIVMLGKLMKLYETIPVEANFNHLRIKCYLFKAQKFHNRAVIALESFDFRTAIRFLEYAREENTTAEKFLNKSQDLELISEVSIMERDILMLQCCCDSVRVRYQADVLFNEQINEAEAVDFRIMWNIADMYKEAVLLTRERDIENEAFALSRLGRVFDTVLKMRVKAHDYYRKAFDLVQTLLPKDMSKAEWYTECKNTLERFQKNIILEEQKREEAEKAPILEKLKPELVKLRAVQEKNDTAEFLKFLYKNYTPKIQHQFRESLLDDGVGHKQALKEAISHYHPDRQTKFGLEWKVLCGEITKILTVIYESHK